MHLELRLPPHYRFEAMIDAHGWPQLVPFSWDGERKVLERIEELASGKVVHLAVVSRERMLDVTLAGPALADDELAEVEQVVRWMLELDEDFEEFYNFCAEHDGLRHIPRRGLGPMLRSPTVWEDYVKTVCTTNTTWAQTKGMVSRLVDAFGALYEGDGRRAFPAANVVARESLQAVAARMRAGYRAQYIHETAIEIAEGRLDIEWFKQRAREVETPVLMAELRKLRGIGPYAAAHLALLLGSYGYIPVDSWARELVRGAFTGGKPVTDREVHAYFEHFGRWRALAFRCWDWDGLETSLSPTGQ